MGINGNLGTLIGVWFVVVGMLPADNERMVKMKIFDKLFNRRYSCPVCKRIYEQEHKCVKINNESFILFDWDIESSNEYEDLHSVRILWNEYTHKFLESVVDKNVTIDIAQFYKGKRILVFQADKKITRFEIAVIISDVMKFNVYLERDGMKCQKHQEE